MEKKEIEKLEKLSFEKALEQLEQVVSGMEGGQLQLEDMMNAYEKGRILSSICQGKLKSIEKKVEILRKKADGEDTWEEFDASSDQSIAAVENKKSNIAVSAEEENRQDLLF